MPNRVIKDSIRTSKSVNAMTDFQFRLWVYLITYVDDYGRGSADPEIIKGFVFPRRRGITESTIEKELNNLAINGSVLLYKVDEELYFCFPNWSDHQRIQTKKSKYPAPEDGTFIDFTVNHGESPSESNPIQSNPNTNPNTNTNSLANARDTRTRESNGSKKAFGKYRNVKLTEKEYATLKAESNDTDEAIELLSEYIERKGYSVKSHYLTIKNWVFNAVKERRSKQANTSQAPGSFNTEEFFSLAIGKSFDAEASS